MRLCQARQRIKAEIRKAVKSEMGKEYQTPFNPRDVYLGKIIISGIKMMNCRRIERNNEGIGFPSD